MRHVTFLAVLLVTTGASADDAACIAASEQALTLRQQAKLHEALKQLATCADAACPDEVKQECSHRISDVDAVMPSLILGAKDAAGSDLDAVTVSMDGAPLISALDGRPVTVDPGEHTFRFEARGIPPVDKKLVVREGEKDRRETVTLIAPPPPKPPPFWNTQRLLGLTSGVVGVVGLGLGAVFGGFAISIQNQEKSDCPAPGCQRYPQAAADYDYAQRNALASTVSFIAGGVLAATGIVLLVTSHTRPTTAAVNVSPFGLSVRGAF
jgi:hypothetical protein